MIYVPRREECVVWNETEDGVYILYFADGNESREVPVRFVWGRSPKMGKDGEVRYEMDYDPFYLSVEECMGDVVLECPMSACMARPQLRYNGIIKKWFCNCPSSALCTKNDDQSELDELLVFDKEYTEENGFCNNMVEAILRWNINCARDYGKIAIGNIKSYRELVGK